MPDAPRVVYFAASQRKGPSSRYRIYQYAEYFAAARIALVIAPALPDAYFDAERGVGLWRKVVRVACLFVAFWRRLLQLRFLPGAQGAVIEREFFPWLPAVFERAIARFGGGYVLELDDAIYLSRGRRRKYATVLGRARAVIAGNATLAAYARRFNDRVVVVPTTVSVARYRPRASYARDSVARIGWVGLSSNFPHLRAIARELSYVCELCGAVVVVVSSRPIVAAFPSVFIPWSYAVEAETIRSFDVGIMPLVDTPFARGKCGLKLLQYMACGLPAVASPVGVNREIVRHDENGMLAKDHDAWRTALASLLGDEERRARLGRAARATVARDYATELFGPRLVALYRELVVSRQGS